MLSDSIRELRRQTLEQARGGTVMSGDDCVALAAKLAAFETAAANLEETVARLGPPARRAGAALNDRAA